MHASLNKKEEEARVVLNEGSDQFYERSIRLRKDSYGYSVMSYGASTDNLSALTKMKFFFEDRLIGEMELTDKDTFEERDTFKVYGRGTMQGLLDKYFVDMIDKREWLTHFVLQNGGRSPRWKCYRYQMRGSQKI